MSYSDLQLNQAISLNNLQSGVVQGYFLAKTSIPSGTKQITKAEAIAYVNIDTSIPSLAGKAFNQLVVRSNLSGITNLYPYRIYILANAGTGVRAWESIDGGNSFNQLGLYPSDNWTEIAGDTTGTYIAVVDSTMSNYVHISNDSGVTFTAKSLNGGDFFPYGVSMSADGQYIAVSGFNIRPDGVATGYAKIAVSSNYGASFTTVYTDGTLRPYGFNNFFQFYSTGRISVSSNGQGMTAIFSFGEYVGFPYNYTRPVGFTISSNNNGTSWTLANVTNYAIFQGIALSETGQYQILTADWYDGNNIDGVYESVRGFVSNNYGVAFTEKIVGNYRHANIKNVGISANGKSIFTSTVYRVGNTQDVFRWVSNDYGVNFTKLQANDTFMGATVGQVPITGITDSYVAVFTTASVLYYNTDGGFYKWFFAPIPNRTYIHVYNKAFTTPELPYTYTLYYNYSAGLPEVEGANSASEACDLSANGIIVYTSSSSISSGMALYYDIYGLTQIQANPSSSGSLNYYRIAGYSIQFSNNYVVNSVVSCGVAYTTYYADEYVCSGISCSFVQPSILVVLPTSVTPDYSKFYLLAAGGSTFYQLTSTTTGSGAILATTAYDCLEICGV